MEEICTSSDNKGPLLEQLRREIRVRHYSIRTEQTYIDWVKRYILYHNKRHPSQMAAPEINDYLSHLATDHNVSSSTQNQALSAIIFLYKHILGTEIGDLGTVIRAKRPERLPVVLTPNNTFPNARVAKAYGTDTVRNRHADH